MNDSTDLLETPPLPPRFILALSLLLDADGGSTRRPPDLAAPADLQLKILDSLSNDNRHFIRKPGLEVHPADGEGGSVEAGGEVVKVVKDARRYWLSADIERR